MATIKRTFKDATSYALINGEDAVTLEVKLREGANAINAKRSIMLAVEDFETVIPENLSIIKTDDETIWAQIVSSSVLMMLRFSGITVSKSSTASMIDLFALMAFAPSLNFTSKVTASSPFISA